ncbi:MAG: hypothetical protein K9J16_18790 [Melioribacteraceae bacterium]|nr:hypothetical protein [Melioribacteraceae bacterium]MCF8356937.1 hypothetical protein [Melioribacteraceae bacterium]MCF8396356.1 hypothetical protein [Melioribacteraceae bacterium]MCF8421200.1 hypothetical protein [Melioribacteraceae bacterium]
MTRSFKYIITTLLIFNGLLSAQLDEFVGIAGNDTISTYEFMMRYEMTPQLYESDDIEQNKINFLATIIAEKLWAQEAVKKGYDKLSYIQSSLNEIEKMYVRDELFKQEIENKAVVPAEKIDAGMRKRAQIYKVKYISTPSMEELEVIYDSLKSGVPFDVMLATQTSDTTFFNPFDVEFGQMNPANEKIIFNLNPGEFSEPVMTDAGPVIFYVHNIVQRVENLDVETRLKKVKDIIRNRMIDTLYSEFNRRFYKDVSVNADVQLFKELNDKLWKSIAPRLNDDNKNQPFVITSNDIARIRSGFDYNKLNSPFIKFQTDPVSFESFIRYLEFRGLKLQLPQQEILTNMLNGTVRNFIRLELLAREGYKRNLDKSMNVKRQVEMWKTNYLAGKIKNDFIDSVMVEEKDVKEKFLGMPEEMTFENRIKIREISSYDSSLINEIAERYNEGGNIEELLSDGKINVFESQFVEQSAYGHLGKLLFELKPGEIYGPVKNEKGYTLYQSINRMLGSSEKLNQFEQEKEGLMQEDFFNQLENVYKDEIIKLAKEYGIKINYDALNFIKVTNMNVVVMQSFGFGEQMLAVPFTNLFYKWLKEYKEEMQLNP